MPSGVTAGQNFSTIDGEGVVWNWRFTEAYMVMDTEKSVPVRLLDGKIISTYDVARETARSLTGMEARLMIVQMYGIRPIPSFSGVAPAPLSSDSSGSTPS